MTQTPGEPTTTDDPLAKLHKMSTTAGLGVGDYVAINPMSVATLVVGLASAAAMLDPILLAVPVVAIVLGLAAITQIRKSSGTQGGLSLAIVGMIAAVGFTGLVGYREFTRRATEKIERQAVVALVDRFGETVLGGKAGDAWELFTPTFHEAFDRQQFILICGTLQHGPAIGSITSMKSNGFVKFDTYSENNAKDQFAQTMMVVTFKSKQDGSSFNDRYDVVLRKVGDAWKIERLDTFFTPPKVTVPKGSKDPASTLTPSQRS
jgi:hypothetical protein